MPHDSLQHYTFLNRVLELQSQFFARYNIDVPAELVELQKNACLEIHTHSLADKAEKEAVMTVIVLASSPPPLYDRVEASADAITRIAFQQLRAANPQDPLTPMLAQAKTAVGIAMMRLAMKLELNAEQAAVMRARGLNSEAEEKRNFSHLPERAFALRQVYADTKAALMAKLDGAINAANAAPAAPQPPRKPKP